MSKAKVLEFQEKIGDILSPEASRTEVYNSLEQIMPVFTEEVRELVEATKTKDGVEVLDGAIDCMVVLIQIIDKLETVGFSTAEALSRVCNNNLLKTTCSEEWILEQHAKYTQVHGKDSVLVSEWFWGTENEFAYCLKDRVTGKVKKPIDHPVVDLEDLVPERFKKEPNLKKII